VLHYRLVVTVDGTPVYGDDQEIRLTPGYAFTFDGTDDYLDLSDHADLPIYRRGVGTAYSIAFWIKAPPAEYGKIIYSEGSSAGSWYPGLRFQAYGTGYSAVHILMYDDNGTAVINHLRATGLLDNTWHHFAWVDTNGTAKVYLDGNQSGSDIIYTPPAVTFDISHLGARYDLNSSYYFPGTLDEVSFWDKALSAAEIRTLMHQPPQGGEANLKAHYRLDDGGDTRLFDAVSAKEASIVGGSSKVFSTVPMGVSGTLVQTTDPTSVGEAGKQLTVDITSASPTTNYLGIYKTGQGAATVTGETFPSGVIERRAILWGIREYGNVTADLVIDYSNVPNISNPGAIKLLKRADAASAWTDVTGDFTHNTTLRTFTKTGETSFSEFSIGDNGENPTAVDLVYFVATATDLGIRLDWQTATELELLGFDLYRAESEADLPVRLNEEPIPGQSSGSPVGGSYSFQDLTAVPGTTYYYWLEVIQSDGAAERYGPVSTAMEPDGTFAIYLPLVISGE
jgi:hypothetical protein